MAVSSQSAKAIRQLLVDTIERLEPLIAAPGEEEVLALCVDFSRLRANE